MNERTIFMAALDIDDPARRAAWLDEACRGDADLRKRVEALIQSHLAGGCTVGGNMWSKEGASREAGGGREEAAAIQVNAWHDECVFVVGFGFRLVQ